MKKTEARPIDLCFLLFMSNTGCIVIVVLLCPHRFLLCRALSTHLHVCHCVCKIPACHLGNSLWADIRTGACGRAGRSSRAVCVDPRLAGIYCDSGFSGYPWWGFHW